RLRDRRAEYDAHAVLLVRSHEHRDGDPDADRGFADTFGRGSERHPTVSREIRFMRRWVPWVSAILSLIISPLVAVALTQSGLPSRSNIPGANSAGSSYVRVIPQASQIGITNCAASLTDGFPPLAFVPQSAGGCPPFGQDFNGILKQITQW